VVITASHWSCCGSVVRRSFNCTDADADAGAQPPSPTPPHPNNRHLASAIFVTVPQGNGGTKGTKNCPLCHTTNKAKQGACVCCGAVLEYLPFNWAHDGKDADNNRLAAVSSAASSPPLPVGAGALSGSVNTAAAAAAAGGSTAITAAATPLAAVAATSKPPTSKTALALCAEASGIVPRQLCTGCGLSFASRSKLFAHLRENPQHAVDPEAVAKANAGLDPQGWLCVQPVPGGPSVCAPGCLLLGDNAPRGESPCCFACGDPLSPTASSSSSSSSSTPAVPKAKKDCVSNSSKNANKNGGGGVLLQDREEGCDDEASMAEVSFAAGAVATKVALSAALTVKPEAVFQGQRVLIAATMAAATVVRVVTGSGGGVSGGAVTVVCRLDGTAGSGGGDEDEDEVDDEEEDCISYRCSQLLPCRHAGDGQLVKDAGGGGRSGGSGGGAGASCSPLLPAVSDRRVVEGSLRGRAKVLTLCGGDMERARKVWRDAEPFVSVPTTMAGVASGESRQRKVSLVASAGEAFASCVRGHLLHAHCFQGALIGGGRCPAPGCAEFLWAPPVERQRAAGAPADEDTCCGGGSVSGAAADVSLALAAAAELETTPQESEASGGGESASRAAAQRVAENTEVNKHKLKMCPSCFGGPILNENCSDLKAHHGQCPRCSQKIRNADTTIASALLQVGTMSKPSAATAVISSGGGGGEASEATPHLLTVGECLPRCDTCKPPTAVLYSGELPQVFVSFAALQRWRHGTKERRNCLS